ncbi:MAG: DUF5684 domain-containing protein [Candidatus Omnitrophota bacterium]|jgi:hypothetical protein
MKKRQKISFIHSRRQNRSLQAADIYERRSVFAMPKPRALARGVMEGFILSILFICMPWASADEVSQKIPDICITGVMYDANNSLVVINDEIVKVGEKLHNVKVVSAVQSTVTLEYEGKTFEKRIGEGCLKIPYSTPQKQSVAPKQKSNSFALFVNKSKAVTNKEGLEKAFFLYGTIFLLILWVLVLLAYVYGAVCLHKIATKTITKYGWFAWIPVLSTFLMLMIVRRSLWWFLLFFVPLVNFVFLIIIWMEITKMRGKPAWLGLLMILPFVNLILLGYLAFSE